MICSKCNQTLPDDSEFCQYCGEKIVTTQKTSIKNTYDFGDAKKVKGIKISIVVIVSIFIICGLTGLNIYQYIANQSLQQNIENLEKKVEEKEIYIKNLLKQQIEKDSQPENNSYDDYSFSSLKEKSEKKRKYHEEQRAKSEAIEGKYKLTTNENGDVAWVPVANDK